MATTQEITEYSGISKIPKLIPRIEPHPFAHLAHSIKPKIATKTFHPFPRLPIELRLKIFGMVMEPTLSRVVELEWSLSCKEWVAPVESYRVPKGRILLRINKESQAEFLNYYHPIGRLFDCNPNGTLSFMKEGKTPITAYFNPKIDTLYAGPLRNKKDRLNHLQPRPTNLFMNLVKEHNVQFVTFRQHGWVPSALEEHSAWFSKRGFSEECDLVKIASVEFISISRDIKQRYLKYKNHFSGRITLEADMKIANPELNLMAAWENAKVIARANSVILPPLKLEAIRRGNHDLTRR